MLVPILRFNDFTESYKSALFEDICTIQTGKSNTQDRVEKGTFPFFVRSAKVEHSDKYLFDCEAVLTVGDGQIGEIFHYFNGKFDCHQRVYILNEFRNITGKYLYYYFATHFYKRVKRMSAKNTVDSVRMEMISKMRITHPSVKEQERVADLLSLLDEKISLQRRKVELLKDYKKGIGDVLFHPTSSWVRIKIGDTMTIMHGKDYKDYLKFDGKYPVYGTSGIIARCEKYLCNWPCVCIGRKGTINRPRYINEPFWSVDTLFYSKPKKGFDPLFQYYLFQRINWEKFSEASGVPSLSASTIENIVVDCPTIEEQKRIAYIMYTIDECVEKEESFAQLLRKYKNGLLNQLFV